MGKKQKCKYSSVGGQALIEGIMMRSPEKTAFTVRKPDGSTVTEYIESRSLKDKIKILKAPILRGILGFVESMIMGYKTLMRSAEFAMVEEDESTNNSKKEDNSNIISDSVTISLSTELDESGEAVESNDFVQSDESVESAESTESTESAESVESTEPVISTQKDNSKKESAFMGAMMIGAMIFGVVLAVALFMWLPALLFDIANAHLFTGMDKFRALFESLVKIFIFVAYLASVTLMSDVKRVFMYHGAEHKTIFCLEKKLPLTTENIRAQKRFHPRCGTSFLVLMLAVNIVINSVILLIFPGITATRALWVGLKILLIPLICGVGYEVLRLCGRYDNILTKIISAPGMWIQRLTTKEPDDSMIEVAIIALKAVLPAEECPKNTGPEPQNG